MPTAQPPSPVPSSTPPTGERRAPIAVATASVAPGRPLRGRHVALLSTAPRSPAARAAQRQAEALGARVSPLAAARDADAWSGDVLWVMGRLYDAVVCDGLPAPRVHALRQALDRPVVDAAEAPAERLLAALR